MNGRELTADDVVFNWHRFTGLGSGFTEKSPYAASITALPIESIEATDEYTVVVKLKQLSFNALNALLYASHEAGWIYPPEVIKEHGNAQDWRNLVGTGPYELADWVEGSSITYTKNPNYWAFDEKYPDNRLPYADEMKLLFMTDRATQMAALRTGKVALVDALGLDDAESLQRTNPELVMTTAIFGKSQTSFALDVRQPPFDDIRVRQAMQLAIDIEAINQSLYNGLADTTPQGILARESIGYNTPFEEWPEEVKANYGYDPERAKQLLAEAGYPDGFKTTLKYVDLNSSDVEYTQIAKDYWAQIGVDVEIDMIDVPTLVSHINAHSYKGMIFGERGTVQEGLYYIRIQAYSNENWNFSGAQDPEFDAIVEAAESATTFEEMQRRDLGVSLRGEVPITPRILSRFPVTFELGVFAIIIGLLISLPIGIYSAIRQNTIGDYAGRGIAVTFISVPTFWTATMVMLYPSIWWGWSPSMELIPFTEDPLGNLGMFLLPAAILGTVLSGTTMRMTRTMALEVLRQDYIRTAWSKGLKEKIVVMRHVLKNALIPVVTLVGFQLPILIGGSVILEQIFVLPGIGRLLLDSIQKRDYPIVSGINLFIATTVVIINLLVDLTYAYLDPRVRYR